MHELHHPRCQHRNALEVRQQDKIKCPLALARDVSTQLTEVFSLISIYIRQRHVLSPALMEREKGEKRTGDWHRDSTHIIFSSNCHSHTAEKSVPRRRHAQLSVVNRAERERFALWLAHEKSDSSDGGRA